jgi:hypothetical protein
VSAEWIGAQRSDSRAMAKAVIDRFEQAATLHNLSFRHRLVEATLGGATDLFGRIGRRFDLMVVALSGSPVPLR